MSDLMLHTGARRVELEELSTIEAPPPTDTWFPIKHSVVLERVQTTLDAAGFQIEKQQLALNQSNTRFFGTLDLRAELHAGVTLTVGVRNSIDKSFPFGLCAGSRCFVCDNLAFCSEIVVTRKHTKFGGRRFQDAIANAMSDLRQFKDSETRRIDWMHKAQLSDDAANSYILQAFESQIVGPRLLPLVIKEWREPKHQEFVPRTVWSLFNSFTEVLKPRQLSQPAAAAHETMRLQSLLTKDSADGYTIEERERDGT